MSNTNNKNNKGIQRGTGNGRAWQPRGRGRARGLSNTPLKGIASIPQTDPEPTTASPLDAQTTRRRMNLMASVSRSSGLQKDGDESVFFSLRNFKPAGVMIEH